MMKSYYDGVFSELRGKTEERGYLFHSTGTPGTTMSELLDVFSIQPGVRHSFGIEGDLSMLVGFIIVPDPKREHSEKAWNRFDQNLRERFAKAEQDGYQGKSLSFVIIQIWEGENVVYLFRVRNSIEFENFEKQEILLC